MVLLAVHAARRVHRGSRCRSGCRGEPLADLGHGVGVVRVPLRLRCRRCRRSVVLVLESRSGVVVAAVAVAAATEEPEPAGGGGGGLPAIFAVSARGETERRL